MRVQCPQCGSGGNIPDEKIPARGTNIVCPKCKTSFPVSKAERPPQAVAAAPKRATPAAGPLYEEGVQLFKTKQIDAAIEKFNAALQIQPEYSEAYRYLGLAYGQKNLWEDASRVLQKAIEYKPDDLLSCKNLGIAYLQLRRFSEAEQAFQCALALAPDDEKTQSYLSMATRGKQQQSAEFNAPAAAAAPKKANSAAHEGTVPLPKNPVQDYLDQGADFLTNAQFNKAIDMFEEAIRLAPKSGDGYFGLGMVYEKRQEWPKAIEAYQKALEFQPDDTLAKENLKFVKKQTRKFKFPWQK